MKLADRTNIFAEGGAAEKPINQKCGEKIANDNPGRKLGAVPEAERLISP